jgi:hypothetical protein
MQQYGAIAHHVGHGSRKFQQVTASASSVSASRRDTASVLRPIANGIDSANSSSSQLLSCPSRRTSRGTRRSCCRSAERQHQHSDRQKVNCCVA